MNTLKASTLVLGLVSVAGCASLSSTMPTWHPTGKAAESKSLEVVSDLSQGPQSTASGPSDYLVEIADCSKEVFSGEIVEFEAMTVGTDRAVPLRWKAELGTISDRGVYRSPKGNVTDMVTVWSEENPELRDSVSLTITDGELTITNMASRSFVFQAASTLELLGRIEYSIPAGGNPTLKVQVNGQVVSDDLPLKNKSLNGCIADGRCWETPFIPELEAWMLNYCPDFDILNTSAAGGYQVTTDVGQACRYVWDISSLVSSTGTMSVTLSHTGAGMGLPMKIRLTPPGGI